MGRLQGWGCGMGWAGEWGGWGGGPGESKDEKDEEDGEFGCRAGSGTALLHGGQVEGEQAEYDGGTVHLQ